MVLCRGVRDRVGTAERGGSNGERASSKEECVERYISVGCAVVEKTAEDAGNREDSSQGF